MKKFFALLCALALSVSLVACRSTGNHSGTANNGAGNSGTSQNGTTNGSTSNGSTNSSTGMTTIPSMRWFTAMPLRIRLTSLWWN